MSWSEFISMGGYGVYVWSAYGFTIIVLVINVIIPMRRRSVVLRALRQFIVTQTVQEK
ncbi:MAG: heme exporter protein CcmD [Proteobacteria bacterium]|nr:MAG: heme exporter protein CcmD [Pseudomonadota bacterium]TDJ72849.1 MAG: heme exporter protein CcmD [Pseudomonadota bacterium]